MDIEKRYQDIIDALKKGHRYLEPINKEHLATLSEAIHNTEDDEQLKKIFCILDNTQSNCREMAEPLISFLKKDSVSVDLKVYALEATRKHIIDGHFKNGRRLPGEYLMALKGLLKQKDPELLEWTLRVIDECGSQSIFFREDVKNIRPSFFKIYNKHYRAILQLCEYLERRWSGHRPA